MMRIIECPTVWLRLFVNQNTSPPLYSVLTISKSNQSTNLRFKSAHLTLLKSVGQTMELYHLKF